MSAQIQVYRSLDEAPADFGPCVLTIGNFDGVHVGHREVFRRVVRIARTNGWRPSALTFDPHPARVVAPRRAPKLLSTPLERTVWMAEEGLEQVVILPFTPEFSGLSPEQFVGDVLVNRLGVKQILIGWNFRFGRNQAGDTEYLATLGERHGFKLDVLEGVQYRGRTVSSSAIRQLLADGNIAMTNRMLGRPYSVSGAIVPGYGIGRRKTVPTLNLRTRAEILPATGVYVTTTTDLESGVQWPSVTNIGYRPTFKGDNLSVESHVLSELGETSPEHIRLTFLKRLRRERKFPDAPSLKAQILKDMGRAKAYFRRVKNWVGNTARTV
jgi:riboflavin kinase/FMN adenylyltransferase